jgi:hypothetical protein
MKAPERAQALDCANQCCRHRIWAYLVADKEKKEAEEKAKAKQARKAQKAQKQARKAQKGDRRSTTSAADRQLPARNKAKEQLEQLEQRLLKKLEDQFGRACADPAERDQEVLTLLRAWRRTAGDFCLKCGGQHSVHCADCLPKKRPSKSEESKPVCEDCAKDSRTAQDKTATWGVTMPEGKKIARWCASCGKTHAHEGAHALTKYIRRTCKDCNERVSNWGPPCKEGEPKQFLYCGLCAKNHPGTIDLANARCEDCFARGVLKYATYGAPGSRGKRWCVPCSVRYHPEAEDKSSNKSANRVGMRPLPACETHTLRVYISDRRVTGRGACV